MIIKTYCCNYINPVGITEPVFSWKVINCADKKQTAYQITVQTTSGSIVWDSGKVNTGDSVYVRYAGDKLEENTKYLWQVTVYTQNCSATSDTAYFITGIYNTESLQWISPDKEINSPLVYKEFEIDNVCEYATVNVCGLGFFELYINGSKVSDDLMNPVRTDYDAVEYSNLKYPYENVTVKSVHYLTYEVSQYLRKGKNTVCVWLGNGWYRQTGRTVEGIFDYGDELKMFLRLTNGSEIVESGNDWFYIESPIVYDNLFYGEIYDARIKLFDFDGGNATHIAQSPVGRVVNQLAPSEKSVNSYSPKYLGEGIYDAGMSMSGLAEITVCGSAGDKVELYFAEDLDKDGNLDYTSSVGYEESDKNQIQKDVYILGGDGDETYMPRFVWHTFRYFKISAPESVTVKAAKVHYVCTTLEQRAFFDCSEEMLNIFHKIGLNTSLSNLHGCVPQDCPHRERLGYTGDGELSSQSVMYSFDAYNAYDKWIEDILDTQNLKTGFVPHTAPFTGGGGGPAWGSSVAVVPWNFYIQYGDKKILSKSKDALKRWLGYLSTRTEDNIVTHEEGGSWCLGDWCMPSKYPWSEPHLDEIKIPSELVNTVYYIYCMDIYNDMLKVLGEAPDDDVLEERQRVADAVNRMLSDGEYAGGEQGCNVFPLFVDVVPEEQKLCVFEKLIKRIEDNEFCFDTGISGTKFVLMVLDRYGRNDVAMKMFLNTKYPSFGNMIKNGATSLWETWEGNGAKNHTAFTSAISWLYYGLAGIKPSGGYKEFSIKPFFAEELDYLNVIIESEYGDIGLQWRRCDGGIDVNISVPFNTTAKVDLNGDCFELEAGDYKYHIGG